jgi:hypothetical protein
MFGAPLLFKIVIVVLLCAFAACWLAGAVAAVQFVLRFFQSRLGRFDSFDALSPDTIGERRQIRRFVERSRPLFRLAFKVWIALLVVAIMYVFAATILKWPM